MYKRIATYNHNSIVATTVFMPYFKSEDDISKIMHFIKPNLTPCDFGEVFEKAIRILSNILLPCKHPFTVSE